MLKLIKYAIGSLGEYLILNASLTMLIYRYDPGINNESNLPLLVSSALVGIAILINRLISAIAQPFVGHFSDRLSSRWGRRRPLMAMGILPFIICFTYLFNPPLNDNSTSNLIRLMGTLCIFYLAFAIYSVPYISWISALAKTPSERVNLATLVAIFSILGTAFGGIASPWLTAQIGFSKMAGLIGAIGLIALTIPLTISEKSSHLDRQHPRFWNSLRLAWQNPSFRSYGAGVAFAWITASILTLCTTFLAVALLNRDLGFGAIINILVLGSAMMGIPLVINSAKHWGKRTTFQVSMIWCGCGLSILGILPILVKDTLFPWLIVIFLSSLGLAGFFILPNAMLPDLIDEDAKRTGLRKEAVYFGTRGLLVESSIGLGAMLSGLILMLGKTPAEPLGVQITLFVAGFFALASAWCFKFYPIKK